jgi:hypothetical protein
MPGIGSHGSASIARAVVALASAGPPLTVLWPGSARRVTITEAQRRAKRAALLATAQQRQLAAAANQRQLLARAAAAQISRPAVATPAMGSNAAQRYGSQMPHRLLGVLEP